MIFSCIKHPVVKLVILAIYEENRVNELHKSRWDNAKTIKGTQSYHQFEVDRSDKKFIFVKNISKSEQFKRDKVFKK